MKLRRFATALSLLVLSMSLPHARVSTSEEVASSTGGLRGQVLYNGADPDTPLPLDAQPACLAFHDGPVVSERIARNESGQLANVLVTLEGAGLPADPAPSSAPLLTQEGCVYQPRVVAMRAGQELVIRNGDSLLHNVHCQPEINPRFNIGQPFQGAESKRIFAEPEIGIPVKCDIHPWMIAFIHVLPHSHFQVTGPQGAFEWSALPAGDYTLRLWHEELGEKTAGVRVEEGRTTEVVVEF